MTQKVKCYPDFNSIGYSTVRLKYNVYSFSELAIDNNNKNTSSGK